MRSHPTRQGAHGRECLHAGTPVLPEIAEAIETRAFGTIGLAVSAALARWHCIHVAGQPPPDEKVREALGLDAGEPVGDEERMLALEVTA